MPKIIMRTNSSIEDYNAGCDYCVVDMTQEYARYLIDKVRLFSSLKKNDLVAMRYADYVAGFYSYQTIDEFFGEEFVDSITETDTCYELPHMEEERWTALQEKCERTESVRISIDFFDVEWLCVPKHSGITVRTSPIVSEKVLEDWARDDGSTELIVAKWQEGING